MKHEALWDLESAMKVLESDTVDSETWAEAVEWLILNGPPEIRKILLNASLAATEGSFPELVPDHYTSNGQPVYDIHALAVALGISDEEVREILKKKNSENEVLDIIDHPGSTMIN